MAKKKKTKAKIKISEGTMAGFAAVFLLFVSMFNPTTSAAIAILLLLVFSAYKYLNSEK